MERNVFVDADSILFTSVYGNKTNRSTIMQRYREKINFIKNQCFATAVYVAVKGADNFRHQIYPDYKANRPELASEVKEKLNFAHSFALTEGAIQSDGWEADDQVRSWAYESETAGIPWVIAGIDKDLLQIPGTHFNYGGTAKKPIPDNERIKVISQKYGDELLAAQLISGDRTDNIIGVKGMGPAKSMKAVVDKSKKGMMESVIEFYKDEFGDKWEEQLYLNAQMVYMRRWPDDEFDYKEWLKDDSPT